VNEGGSLPAISITASDEDLGDSITLSMLGAPSSLTINDAGNGVGAITGTLTYDDAGSYYIVVTATDDSPVALSDSETVFLNVYPAPQPVNPSQGQTITKAVIGGDASIVIPAGSSSNIAEIAVEIAQLTQIPAFLQSKAVGSILDINCR